MPIFITRLLSDSEMREDTGKKFNSSEKDDGVSRSGGTVSGKEKDRPCLQGVPVCCGFPSPAEQYAESPLDLNELLVTRPAATYFVRAAGDSMQGAGIREDDILVVDRSLEAQDGSVVIACVDGEFTVKYLRQGPEGLYLEPANRKYRPIRFTDGMELRLFGVVTAVIHQFVTGRKRQGPA